MAVSIETYKKNSQQVSDEANYIGELLNTADKNDSLKGLNYEQRQQIRKLREACAAVQEDFRKTAEAEEQKKADETELARNPRAPQKTYYQTNETLMQQHLNQLENLPAILQYKIGDKTLKEILAPDAKARDDLNGSLRALGQGLDKELAPKGADLYYEAYLYEHGTALNYIDSLKDKIASPSFKEFSDIQKQEMVAAIFASRMTVNSVMGLKYSLDKEMDKKDFRKNFQSLMKSENFRRFVNSTSSGQIASAMSGGHGGTLEKMYQAFNVKQTKPDASYRHAPLAIDRIEHLQKALKDKNLTEAARKDLIIEIMATRIAAKAVRGKKDSLKTPVSAAAYEAARRKIDANKTFKEMLDDPKHLAAMSKSLTGMHTHGGGVEAYVQKYTAQKEGYLKGSPEWLNPKMPPLPKNFQDAQDALKAARERQPANPALVNWHIAAAVYMANAVVNPSIDPTKDMVKRIGQVQNNEVFQHMINYYGVNGMTNIVNKGAGQVNFEFAQSQQRLPLEKKLAEIKQANKEEELGMQVPEGQQGQQGPEGQQRLEGQQIIGN